MRIDHIEIVFDPTRLQVSLFYILKDAGQRITIEKHWRNLTPNMYTRIVELHMKYRELIKEREVVKHREYVYSDFDVIKSFENAVDRIFFQF